MGSLKVDIPEDLHRAVKSKAAEKGVTIKDIVIELLYGWVKKPSK